MNNLTDQTLLAEALPIGIVMLNEQGHLFWANKKAKQLLQLRQAHQGRLFSEIISYPEFFKILKQKPCNRIFETSVSVGVRISKQLSLTMVDYINNSYLVCIEDITHTHLLEKIRQDFIANVSHELRTPLTVIHGYMEILVDLKGKFDSIEKWQPIFEQMYSQSTRMEKLVSDLLLLSKLETEIPINHAQQTVNVVAIVEKLCQQAQILSGKRAHKIHFTSHSDKQIKGQPDELESAFGNIIFNAVNYTPEKGQINVSWAVNDEGAYLQVSDTGIGIKQPHIPRLTERFYRVDKARSRTMGGTGLGLAIVKHVLLRHNAYLEIASQVGKGSQFTCHFNPDQIENATK